MFLLNHFCTYCSVGMGRGFYSELKYGMEQLMMMMIVMNTFYTACLLTHCETTDKVWTMYLMKYGKAIRYYSYSFVINIALYTVLIILLVSYLFTNCYINLKLAIFTK